MRTLLFSCLIASPLVVLPLAAGCGDDGPNDVAPDAAVDILPDADPGCPELTAVLPNEWRPINAVSAGAVTEIEAGVVYVDATAGGLPNAPDSPFTYIRFGDTATKVEITDTQSYTDATWDLALKRSVIRTNSGDSGPANLSVAFEEVATLAEVVAEPDAVLFEQDNWVDNEACTYLGGLINEPVTAVGTWYDYDEQTNKPTPKTRVYVLKRADGAAYKFRFQTYYYDIDNTGAPASANYAIEWAPL